MTITHRSGGGGSGGGSGGGGGKELKVKLERLDRTTSPVSRQRFKRPRPIPEVKEEPDDTDNSNSNADLKPPPVKLTVKKNGAGNPCQVYVVNSSLEKKAALRPSTTEAQNNNTTANNTNANNKSTTAQHDNDADDEKQTSAKSKNSSKRKTAHPALKSLMGTPIAKKPPLPPLPPPKLFDSVHMTSKKLKEAVEAIEPSVDGRIPTSIYVSDGCETPTPKPAVALGSEEMNPPTPCYYVNSKEEAFSPQLLDLCLKRPIVLVRNLAPACDLDLSLYTTKTLVDSNPDHPVEIRTQMEQDADENWAPDMEKPVWYCTSSRDHQTIKKYAEYQAEEYRKYSSETDNPTANPKMDLMSQPTRRLLRFGTNCDLSNEAKWGPQLRELNKLPAWARVVSAGNMLSHIGNQILGMNTVQLYMKVPCARTPGHQENNNFCAVNINIGPGDSEWFGVPNEYWGALQRLCAKNGVDYLHGSWWPKMEELREAGIPCYRFMQRPGDLVWVNVGCVHWVQAAGWCNNIAWNVGPMTARQFELALERYEWNKSQRYQSIVAMGLLTWNLARNLKVADPLLWKYIRRVLQQSIRASIQIQTFVKGKGVPVRFHGRRKNEPAHYCGECDEEVFNNLFVKDTESTGHKSNKKEKAHVVYCLRCSLTADPSLKGIICLEEYPLDDLLKVYDDFQLQPLTAPSRQLPTSRSRGYSTASAEVKVKA